VRWASTSSRSTGHPCRHTWSDQLLGGCTKAANSPSGGQSIFCQKLKRVPTVIRRDPLRHRVVGPVAVHGERLPTLPPRVQLTSAPPYVVGPCLPLQQFRRFTFLFLWERGPFFDQGGPPCSDISPNIFVGSRLATRPFRRAACGHYCPAVGSFWPAGGCSRHAEFWSEIKTLPF
jgi:hypothetical protein